MQVFHSTHLAAGRRVKYAAPIMEKKALMYAETNYQSVFSDWCSLQLPR